MDVQVIVFWSRVVAGALAGVGLLLAVWGAARWRPGREKKFCPGERVRGVRRWSPLRIAWPRPCGYDLSGLPVDGAGAVICPECGRRLFAAHAALRSTARWRPGRLGAAVTVLAVVVMCAPMMKTKSWQKYVPTTVLIGV